MGYIPCGLIYKRYYFKCVSPGQSDVIEAATENNGRYAGAKDVARRLHITGHWVKGNFTLIFQKLDLKGSGSKTRAAVLYLAYKERMRQEDEHVYSGA